MGHALLGVHKICHKEIKRAPWRACLLPLLSWQLRYYVPYGQGSSLARLPCLLLACCSCADGETHLPRGHERSLVRLPAAAAPAAAAAQTSHKEPLPPPLPTPLASALPWRSQAVTSATRLLLSAERCNLPAPDARCRCGAHCRRPPPPPPPPLPAAAAAAAPPPAAVTLICKRASPCCICKQCIKH